MKRTYKILSIALFTMLGIINAPKAEAQVGYDEYAYDNYGASYQDFYDGLSPYGQWINDPQYGYVWMPNVGADFRPYYTNGYWAMTQYGNTWVSNYDWGWATFHYGRWTFDNYYGWLWIPDTQWAPAWVSWRSNNNYYGWAPMGPGVGISVSLNLIPVDWWVFLSPNYFYEPGFHRYCNNDWRYNRNIYRQTSYINYTYRNQRNSYYTGPRREDYRRHTGRDASMFSINNTNRRGGTNVRGNKINMYTPTVRRANNDAPNRIVQTDRRVSSRPQTFNNTNEQLAGRDRILNQTPIENNVRKSGDLRNNSNTPQNNPNQYDRRNVQQSNPNANQENVRDREIQVQRERRLQMEQNRQQMLQQQRENEMNNRNVEQQRVQQENNRQRVVEQRNTQIDRQEEERQRAQQIRDNQIQQQRIQEENRQRAIQQEQQQRNQQAPAPRGRFDGQRAPVPLAPMREEPQREKPSFRNQQLNNNQQQGEAPQQQGGIRRR